MEPSRNDSFNAFAYRNLEVKAMRWYLSKYSTKRTLAHPLMQIKNTKRQFVRRSCGAEARLTVLEVFRRLYFLSGAEDYFLSDVWLRRETREDVGDVFGRHIWERILMRTWC
jgi:hypothetical protein